MKVISSDKTLRDAAVMLQTLQVGAFPVIAGERLRSPLTNRDITVRGLALGLGLDSLCLRVMSTELPSALPSRTSKRS